MLRTAKLAVFVMVAIPANFLQADQGGAFSWVPAPIPEATVTTYPAARPAPLSLPPPPAPAITLPAPAIASPALPVTPLVATPAGAVVTYRPVLPVIPMPAQYYLGRGLLGQPKLYVPNQPLRNFVRYLSP